MNQQTLYISQIRSASNNPRLDLGNLDELEASMQAHGLIQPITVRQVAPDDDGRAYEIVAGHRRFQAAQNIGWDHLTAFVMPDASDAFDVQEMHLIENVQRENLTPCELALAVGKLLKAKKRGGQAKLAKNLGKSPAWVSKLATIAKALPVPIPVHILAMTDIDKLYAWATKGTAKPAELTDEEEAAAKKAADEIEKIETNIAEAIDVEVDCVSYQKKGKAHVITLCLTDEQFAHYQLVLEYGTAEAKNIKNSNGE